MANNSRGQFVQDNFDFLCGEPKVMGAGMWLNEFQNAVSDGSSQVYARLRPGQSAPQTYDGKKYRYVEIFGGAVAEGDLLVPADPIALTAVNTSASDNLTVTATAGAQIYANQFRGGYIYAFVSGTSCRRRVVSNQAAANGATVTLQLERAFPADLSTATAIIWHPYRMKQYPSTSTGPRYMVHGVSFGAVSAPTGTAWYAGGASYYGWMQWLGSCDRIKFTGDITALSATQPLGLVPATTTAGTAVQQGTTAANQNVFGYIDLAINPATTTSGPGYVSGILTNCLG